ncbi:hypothetical protein [Sporosarcina sp. E16_8]|uniref:hypothetical protein n=1 Tax=Sporosarcina sp. E16_8 TaxID=2789295 RepID=UPI001A93095A|nr:hypothetical protein [Sporosarcina sp. E16_8]MBO0587168.1 hypothetical protein [Sporosarcina sp. E16_8]
MSKRSGIFDVSIKTDLLQPEKSTPKGMSVEKALFTITQQMKLNGYRERTLSDYTLIFNKFAEITRVQ